MIRRVLTVVVSLVIVAVALTDPISLLVDPNDPIGAVIPEEAERGADDEALMVHCQDLADSMRELGTEEQDQALGNRLREVLTTDEIVGICQTWSPRPHAEIFAYLTGDLNAHLEACGVLIDAATASSDRDSAVALAAKIRADIGFDATTAFCSTHAGGSESAMAAALREKAGK